MLKFGHEYHDNQYNTIYQVRPGLGGPDKGYAETLGDPGGKAREEWRLS